MPIDHDILDIVTHQSIADQRALLGALAARGHVLTQSALSRRLGRMGIVKRDGRYARVDPVREGLPPCRLVASPPNLLVVRTTAGFAQAVALAIDHAAPDGLAGTLAGDDTVMVAADDPERLPSLRQAIEALLEIR